MRNALAKINLPFIHRYGLMAMSLILGIVTCVLVF